MLKPTIIKKSSRQDREHKVLLGLVDYYLRTGKPVGSNTLKETGFEDLSSATIRNYFANLEAEGYLQQQHTSGGRIPTPKAYRTYANEYSQNPQKPSIEQEKSIDSLRNQETREIASYLQNSAEVLSSLTQTAVFLSAPRFDHDFIIDLKIIPIDTTRCLCVIVTDFGVIRSEVLPIENKLTAFAAKRIESYFHWRLTGHNEQTSFEPGEEQLAHRLYNELLMRYIVSYSNFIEPELFRTGMSKLLKYPDFQDVSILSNSLALFESAHNMHLLIKECCKSNRVKLWIHDDLANYSSSIPDCSILAIPYYINQNIAGAIGLLGPMRMPYRELFGILQEISGAISEALTRNLYKYKITFRQPHTRRDELEQQDYKHLLLENRT